MRQYGIAAGVSAALLVVALAPSWSTVAEHLRAWLARRVLLAAVPPALAVLAYVAGITRDWKMLLAGWAYVVAPSLLLRRSAGKPPGAWQDYAALAIIWAPVEFRGLARVFPDPWPMTYTLSILTAMSTATSAFLLVRRLDGVGYLMTWRTAFAGIVGRAFLLFAAIAIPLGLSAHLLIFDATLRNLIWFPVAVGGFLVFVAWPEEFFFRGLLQNFLSRTLRSDRAGLAVTAVLFGVTHLALPPVPNWKYAVLATIAGIFYGRTWMKTGSLLPTALLHALVDATGWALFP